MLDRTEQLIGIVGLAFALIFAYLAVTTRTEDIEGSIAYGIMAVAALVATYSLITEPREKTAS